MKSLQIAILLLVFNPPSVSGMQRSAEAPPLQLTSKIVGQRYCVGSADIDFLHLKLQLRFTNVGNGKLILYKGSNLYFKVLVNSNPDRPSAAPYELKTTTARYLSGDAENVDKPAPSRDFIVLSPSSVFDTEINVSLPVVPNAHAPINGTITPGEHLLRITCGAWYESKRLGERLRERWRQKGLLWLDNVDAAPVKFSSREQGLLESCQRASAFGSGGFATKDRRRNGK